MPTSSLPSKRIRVIINTDAKNEADDQYAIVHAILTPMFELHGIIPAHFGQRISKTSQQDSQDEVLKILDLMKLTGKIPLHAGAPTALPDEKTPVDSPGARFIIEEALKDDPRPLHVAFLGPLTDMASALLLEPSIAERNVRVVWIGGGEWPVGGFEYNLWNDVGSANVVFRSKVEVWQVPSTLYKVLPVSYAELAEKVYDKGPLGKYLGGTVDRLEQTSLGGKLSVVSARWHRASFLGRLACSWRDHVSGERLVGMATRPRVQCRNELRSHRQVPSHQSLHVRGYAVYPRGLLC